MRSIAHIIPLIKEILMKPKKNVAQNNRSVDMVNDFLGTVSQPPVTKESLKAELVALVSECYNAIAEPAKLSGLLRNVEFYRTNLDSEAFGLLSKLTDILVKDLTQFRDALQSIENEQNSIFAASDDIEEIQINAFGISNQYTQWLEQYGNVVLPVVGDITGLMNNAVQAADTKKAELKSAEGSSEVITHVPESTQG